MLIEDEWKIYLNCKIREIILFLKKLTPKDKKETAVILKNFLNEDRRHNHITMLTLLISGQTKGQHEKLAPANYEIPLNLIDELSELYIPECDGNSYHKLLHCNQRKMDDMIT